MGKEEIVTIRTCALKLDIHCAGCKKTVKEKLHEVRGVYSMNIDPEQGKVIVSGEVTSDTLIEKLAERGKVAEVWGATY